MSSKDRAEKPPLGEQELEVLRHVVDHTPVTVREVAESFGEERGLARTTLLTVMERLRKKGYLVRRKADGAFQYSPAVEKEQLLRGLVQRFVERTLGGSVSPFVAYLSEAKGLSTEEVKSLKELLTELEEGERHEP